MNTDRLKYLYHRYQAAELTEAETQEWELAVGNLSMDEVLLSLIDKDWDRVELKSTGVTEDEKKIIYEYIVSQSQNQVVKKHRLWQRIAGIAAAIAIIVSGAYFFNYHYKQSATHPTENPTSSIKPGRNAATLTLASGKKIVLSDVETGTVAKEAGVSITKTANGQVVYNIIGAEDKETNKINTLSTAKGETYVLTLPDNTTVWLNSASTIEYNANFTTLNERRVKLGGEAYFEVSKDRKHPFIVETANQTVRVLGTHFNVSAYSDESITKTTLIEGSVQLNRHTILKPGEQSVLAPNGEIDITAVDVNKAIAWKNGKFVFDEENIESIMKKLSRWYNIEVIYQGNFSNRTFVGSISKYDDISKILNKITFTQAVHFKIEGRRIYVMP